MVLHNTDIVVKILDKILLKVIYIKINTMHKKLKQNSAMLRTLNQIKTSISCYVAIFVEAKVKDLCIKPKSTKIN